MKYWLHLYIVVIICQFWTTIQISRDESDEVVEYDHERQIDSHHWKGICTTGKEESPINITLYQLMQNNSVKFYNEKITYNDFTFEANIYANPNYIKVTGPSDKAKVAFSITFNDSSTYNYRLDNIHFHSPSEHTIRTQNSDSQGYYAAEAHFVHTLLNGNLKRNKIVIGVFFYLGTTNDPWIDSLELVQHSNALTCKHEEQGGTNSACYEEFDPTQTYTSYPIPNLKSPRDILMRANGTLYKYAGGLTTPNCDEIVNWYVFDTPLSITRETLKVLEYESITGKEDTNVRLIQPINQRTIYIENSLVVMSKDTPYYINLIFLSIISMLFLL